ncbi:hypothetical protein KJ586_00030 [Patescibacteria group bacterium]|nr:hypothetical protein [Patescibacteria group bacterium]MBU4454893.1 hypothetical protein [Patescibacteria group bacterium]
MAINYYAIMIRFLILLILPLLSAGCSISKNLNFTLDNEKNEQSTLVNNINANKMLASTTVLSYADVINENSFIQEKNSDGEMEKHSIYRGKNVQWMGRVANRYSQIDGIKFCIIDDKHKNADSRADCDWFWLFPVNLATENSPERQTNWDGFWPSYMFKTYSGLNPEKIDWDKDTFLIYGEIEDIDLGVDGLNRPIPTIIATKIEKIN